MIYCSAHHFNMRIGREISQDQLSSMQKPAEFAPRDAMNGALYHETLSYVTASSASRLGSPTESNT